MAADTEPLEILLHLPLLAEDKVKFSSLILLMSVHYFFTVRLYLSNGMFEEQNLGIGLLCSFVHYVIVVLNWVKCGRI